LLSDPVFPAGGPIGVHAGAFGGAIGGGISGLLNDAFLNPPSPNASLQCQ